METLLPFLSRSRPASGNHHCPLPECPRAPVLWQLPLCSVLLPPFCVRAPPTLGRFYYIFPRLALSAQRPKDPFRPFPAHTRSVCRPCRAMFGFCPEAGPVSFPFSLAWPGLPGLPGCVVCVCESPGAGMKYRKERHKTVVLHAHTRTHTRNKGPDTYN
jgi:hypothetical protein